MKICPACGSNNVRRSSIRTDDMRVSPFHSPYRCRACGSRFWVISRRARRGFTILAFAGAILVAVAAGSVLIAHREAAPPPNVDAVEDDDSDQDATPPRDARAADPPRQSADPDDMFPRIVPPTRKAGAR